MATKTKTKAKKSAKKAAAKRPAGKASAKRPAAKIPQKAKAPPKTSSEPQRATGPGTYCWNELLTKDVAGAWAFYGGLFGWKVQTMDMGPSGKYTIWMRGTDRAGGCMAMPPELAASGAPPHWMGYVEVADVDASARKATELGGKVCHGPADIPGIGRFAVLTDPQGADLCIFKPAPMSG